MPIPTLAWLAFPRSALVAAGLLTAGGVAAQSPGTGAAAVPPPPHLTLIHDAQIRTEDARQATAGAMAFTDNGLIWAVGDEAALLAAHPDATRVDLGGRTVIPGLIDSHGHLNGLAESLTRASLVGTQDKAEIIERLREHAAKLGPNDWLLGRGWDQNDWPEHAFPTRQDLDAAFPDRPVWLRRIDGHAGWANSAALARARRDLAGDWQPQGGFIHRDADGQPTGILVDHAMGLIDAVVPATPEPLMTAALQQAIARMLSLGMTGVHDPGIDRADLDRYRRLLGQGGLLTRVYAMVGGTGELFDWLCALGPLADPSGRLYMRAVKLYADGALGSRGAALLQDYSDDPGNVGLLFQSDAQLQDQVNRIMACGFQVAVHAIGDRANRQVLDALEAGQRKYPDNPGRHRVEHAQILDAADVPRFAKLGVIAAMQPTHATSDMYWAPERLGEARLRYAYAWRSLLDSGARLAFGSDFPVEEVNPVLGIYAAVTRQDLSGWPPGGWQPQERVSREEALRGFTLDAAYAGFMEQEVGSLEAGKRADFVVLDRDIMTVPAGDILATRVLQTWLDGVKVYEAP